MDQNKAMLSNHCKAPPYLPKSTAHMRTIMFHQLSEIGFDLWQTSGAQGPCEQSNFGHPPTSHCFDCFIENWDTLPTASINAADDDDDVVSQQSGAQPNIRRVNVCDVKQKTVTVRR